MNTISLIKALSSTASRNDKEQLLMDAFMTGERTFFAGARLAYDNLMTFGVQKVALIEEEDDSPGAFSFQQFVELARCLAQRELTGHAARDAINAAAETCHVETWNLFYRRILLKDLKIGVEAKTFNKVLTKAVVIHPEAAQYIIPIFGVQLAADGKKPEHAKKIKGKRFLDMKLDGVRVATILDKENNMVTQFTRNGIINENFPHITTALKLLMAELPTSVMIDGEMVGSSFQVLMKQINRKDDAETGAMRLALFDIVPLADFHKGVCKTSQEDRHAALCELQTSGLLVKYCGDSVYVIPKMMVDLDTEEGLGAMNEFNRVAIASGVEGIMIKDPAAPYVVSRNTAWIKKKPKISVSLEVVGLEEGKTGSKFQGTTGALVCKGEDDGFYIETNVGSGLTDAQRAEFWDDPDSIIGMIVEVEADTLTKADGSDFYSLRFPVYLGVRGTQKYEKI